MRLPLKLLKSGSATKLRPSQFCFATGFHLMPKSGQWRRSRSLRANGGHELTADINPAAVGSTPAACSQTARRLYCRPRLFRAVERRRRLKQACLYRIVFRIVLV